MTGVAQQAPAALYVAPIHLRSMDEICATFGVRRSTARKWFELGAPIACEEGRYSAEYNALNNWRNQKFGFSKKHVK